MNNEKLDYGQSDNTDAQQSAAKRRRFIHGVGAAVPLLMTIAPRSALAVQCLSPSAQASISLTHSREDRTQSTCNGRSPGYWSNAPKTHKTDWDSSGAENQIFGSVFSYPTNLSSMSFQQVLENGNASDNGKGNEKGNEKGTPSVPDDSKLGFHLVAAWCNLMTGKVPEEVLSLKTLKDMSTGAGSPEGYIAVAGATGWGPEKVVAFICSTFGSLEV